MANRVALNSGVSKKYCELGDVFLINGDPYILSAADYNKLLLVSLKDGCRWEDAYSPMQVNANEYSIEEITNRITENCFGDDVPEVEYVGSVKIEVSKL